MKLKITVHGVAYEVEVEVLDPGDDLLPTGPLPAMRSAGAGTTPAAAAPSGGAVAPPPSAAARPGPKGPAPTGDAPTVVSPIAGTVLEVTCAVGDRVDGQKVLLIIEAMKMKTSICAPP